ncbi:MAG: 4-hydroxy-tetrahydrodipicolinate synthase [Sphingomonadaceae bacterium]
MLTSADVKGVIAAIVTPFDENGQVSAPGIETIVEYLVSNGVHAIMTTGGTGEFPMLLREERKYVTRLVAEQVNHRIPVIAGTASCSTQETLLLMEDAAEAGADAAIVVAPYYFKLPEDSLYGYYLELADRGALPVILYNNPLYTGNNLSPTTMAKLADHQRIIGVKQSNSNMGELVELIRLAGSKMAVTTGIDSQFFPALCVGATGIFSTAASVIPKQMVEVYDLFVRGKREESLELHMKLQLLNRFLEYDPGYVTPAKDALTMMGYPAGPVRQPQPELTDEQRRSLREALVELGLLKA